MYWIIARKNHSGGEAVVALDNDGSPFYSYDRGKELQFYKKVDAVHYMEYCKKNMATIEGQKEFEVLGVKPSKIKLWR